MPKPIEPENTGSELTLKESASQALDLAINDSSELTALALEVIDTQSFISFANSLDGSKLELANSIHSYLRNLAKRQTVEQNSEMLSKLVTNESMNASIRLGIQEGEQETINQVNSFLGGVTNQFLTIKAERAKSIEEFLQSHR
jgi:hypothetical protein